MARLYIDEDLPLEVAIELRKRSHDVLTAVEAGIANKRIQDPDVLAYATIHRRAVITMNRHDFKRLHWRYPDHAGIIVCTDDSDHEALADRIDKLLHDTPVLDRMLLRVTRPQR